MKFKHTPTAVVRQPVAYIGYGHLYIKQPSGAYALLPGDCALDKSVVDDLPWEDRRLADDPGYKPIHAGDQVTITF